MDLQSVLVAASEGLYDEAGRFLAPLAANTEPAPRPLQFCIHGVLCPACAKR